MVLYRFLILACAVLGVSTSSAGEHFNFAFVDIELRGDSVRMTVQADRLDLLNTVGVFPYSDGQGDRSVRLYENRIESYLQQKLALRADGKRLYMPVVQWKRGGSSREDGFDSVSIYSDYHYLTFGAKLPKNTQTLTFYSELWTEQSQDNESPAKMEITLFQNQTALKRAWTFTEKTVRFAIHPDSLAKMRRSPPPAGIRRIPVDHSEHND